MKKWISLANSPGVLNIDFLPQNVWEKKFFFVIEMKCIGYKTAPSQQEVSFISNSFYTTDRGRVDKTFFFLTPLTLTEIRAPHKTAALLITNKNGNLNVIITPLVINCRGLMLCPVSGIIR